MSLRDESSSGEWDGGLMCGIKIPQQEFALKMQGGFCARGGIFAGHYGNYLLRKCTNACSQTQQVVLEALPYFEGRLLILVPNIRQNKHYFCVLVCCTGSGVYLAGRHLKKSRKLDFLN